MTSSISELIDEQGKRQKLEKRNRYRARSANRNWFPQVLPTLPGLQLAAICRPAGVGGDVIMILF